MSRGYLPGRDDFRSLLELVRPGESLSDCEKRLELEAKGSNPLAGEEELKEGDMY